MPLAVALTPRQRRLYASAHVNYSKSSVSVAKWPGVRRAGQAALLAVRKASVSSDDGEGDDEV